MRCPERGEHARSTGQPTREVLEVARHTLQAQTRRRTIKRQQRTDQVGWEVEHLRQGHGTKSHRTIGDATLVVGGKQRPIEQPFADDHPAGLIDGVIPEPTGGAHHDHQATAVAFRDTIVSHLKELAALSVDQLLEARYAKFRDFGEWQGKE